MKSEKGFTLLEVLAAVAILSVASLMLYTVFSNATLFSAQQEHQDHAVNIARTVMEEVRTNLMNQDSVAYGGQNIDLASLRTQPAPFEHTVLFHPNAADRQYRITIRSLPFTSQDITVTGSDGDFFTLTTGDHYRLIEVVAAPNRGSAAHSDAVLQSYVNAGDGS